MAVKSLSIRIDEEMLNKLHVLADYEGRSANSEILILIRDAIEEFEKAHGKIALWCCLELIYNISIVSKTFIPDNPSVSFGASSLYTREPLVCTKMPPRCLGAGVLRTPLRSRSTDRGGSRDGVMRKLWRRGCYGLKLSQKLKFADKLWSLTIPQSRFTRQLPLHRGAFLGFFRLRRRRRFVQTKVSFFCGSKQRGIYLK